MIKLLIIYIFQMPSAVISWGYIVKCGCKGTNN